MTNNLKVLKEDLKAFAKKVKGFKYTDSALITFLLTGAISLNGVSAETSIKAQAEALNTSMTNLKDKIKVARQESEKSLKGENMELIQLMEQGDHVVKSPWSSWQYGINGFYNNWRGTYKGRGNKTADVKYKRNNSLEKFKYDSRTHTLYGNTTELGLEREPNAMIPVSASVTPIIPRIKHADISMAVDISDLPSFNPRTVKSPKNPTITSLDEVNEPNFKMNAVSLGNDDDIYYFSPRNEQRTTGNLWTGHGIIETVALTRGNIITSRVDAVPTEWNGPAPNKFSGVTKDHGIWNFTNNALEVKNVFRNATMKAFQDPVVYPPHKSGVVVYSIGSTLNKSNTATVTTNTTPVSSDPKTGFFKMTGSGASAREGDVRKTTYGLIKQPFSVAGKANGADTISYNNANVLYTRKQSGLKDNSNLSELAHLDLHFANTVKEQKDKLTNLGTSVIPSIARTAFEKAADIAIANNKAIDTAADGTKTMAQTFINNGTVVLEGRNVAFSNSYDHLYAMHFDQNTKTDLEKRFDAGGIVVNTGNIISHPYKDSDVEYNSHSAAFIVSNDTMMSKPYNSVAQYQILYNSGNIDLYNKNSAVFFLNPSDKVGSKIDGDYRDTYLAGSDKPKRPITIVNKENITIYGEKSVGVYVKTPVDLTTDFKDNAGIDFKPMTIYGDNSIGLYVQKLPTNERTTINGNFAVNIGDSNDKGNQKYTSNISADISNAPTSKTTAGNYLTDYKLNNDDETIENSYGIFTASDIDFETPLVSNNGIKNGHQITIYGNTKNNIGVLTGLKAKSNIGTEYKLGDGTIGLKGGEKNIGIALNGQKGATVTADKMVLSGGNGNTAIYAMGDNNTTKTESVTVNSVNDASVTSPFAPAQTKNSVVVYADGGSKVTVNNAFNVDAKVVSEAPTTPGDTSTQNAGGVYASGKDTVVELGSKVQNTSITIQGDNILNSSNKATGDKAGFGLFADKGAKIKAIKGTGSSTVKVKDGSAAIVSLGDTNTNTTSEIDLTGATVDYEGEGYALYTDKASGSGANAINLSAGKLILSGNSVGYIYDYNNKNAINLTGTDIDVKSNEVIIADLRNVTSIDVDGSSTPNTLKEKLIGTGIGNIGSSNGKNKYKYAVVDNATINIKADIDKADTTTDSDSEVFTKRFLYQNSVINVDPSITVKAELDTSQLKAIDDNLTAPVGLAVTASSKSTNNQTTGINNSGIISADRTDGTDKGGIGLYVDHGFINNNNSGVVNIEKAFPASPNKKGIGMYGTNSTDVKNKGKVNVSGEKAIGILGLSYRIDSANNNLAYDPARESYYESVNKAATVAGLTKVFGKVNIENSADGEVTMADNGAVGLFVKNNSIDQVKVAGVYQNVVTNSDDRRDKEDIVGVNKGKIMMNGSDSSVGMGANNGTITNAKNSATSTGEIYVNGTKSAGMYGTKNSDLINNGRIDVVATSAGNESIGMFIDDQDSTITNSGTINVGQSSYGIFGKTVKMTGGLIDVADDGVGVYSTGPSVSLSAGTINVADNNAVGVYIADDPDNPQDTNVVSGVDMTVGDTDSFGYLITAKNAKTNLTINPTSNPVHLGEKSVYVYSQASKSLGGKIVNSSDVITDKNNGYAIYSSQDSENHGYIDLRSGKGNIGIYSTEGIGKNAKDGVIEVGLSDVFTKQFGIGMATGYYNESSKVSSNMGIVENHGTINVANQNSVGMYAVGSGSKAINAKDGVINLSGNNTTGMYIDRGATGENYGTIQTTPTGAGTGIKGVVVTNGGILKNYGTINIVGSKNMGVYVYKGSDGPATYEEHGNKNISTVPVFEGTTTDQKITGKAIVKVPPASLPSPVSISIDGVAVAPTKVDTNIASPKAPEVLITDLSGVTTLNLAVENMDHEHTHSNAEISELGMYVDTSGINYTNPIRGIENLNGLTSIDLVMGTEVTKYLNAKAIQIGDKILTPYNEAIGNVVRTGVVLNINSSSLTWIAQPVKSNNFFAPIETVYMVKVPYTDFASKNDVDTLHFLDGLEQRYGVEGIHSREKQIFNKLNDLNKSEPHIFAQAVNEMKGYEYSNNQQRINATGNALDKEFRYLWKDWRNPSKQNNKIKVFGMKDEYNTDTAGVIDYDSNAYGVAYVHEDETVKLGNSIGWYAGAVTNRFKFKDLGKSKEEETMIKAGIFKTMSPRKDYNGALRWTIAADVFGGINDMHRKYWVVDDTFDAKSRYYSYGAALKNELGYDIRLSERTHLRPYGALKMEYGRFSNIKEDSGQMKLEVKDNNYFSVKPEAGLEFKYIQPLAVRTKLSVGLTAAYENELGKLNKMNQARVRYTTADWYNLRNEKEDRKGSGKFDLNIGVDNTRFGVTVNAGYDTRGKNVRGGIGFRAIY